METLTPVAIRAMDAEELILKMKELVPGTPAPPQGYWIMERILKEGVSVQEEMISSLVQTGEYKLVSRERTEKEERKHNNAIVEIRDRVLTMLDFWKHDNIQCYILSGPKATSRDQGNDFFEYFETMIILPDRIPSALAT